ncbi:MAG TPA: hypothetical protein VHK27_01935 [Gammaproteobacteria bacterium]|nr:hypothetical protein [Gammaproteobacteria bacterium]
MPSNLNTVSSRLLLAKAYLNESDMKQEALDQINAAIDLSTKKENNENELMRQMASFIRLMQCFCKREYPYSGKGVKMCGRCRVLVLYELHTNGKSETQEHFDREKA